MSRKDFELIAATLRDCVTAGPPNSARYCALQFAACKLADALASTNARFDRARFLRAAGVTEA